MGLVIKKQDEMTSDEMVDALEAVWAARDSGDKELYEELSRELPVIPHFAKIMVSVYGKEFVQKNFNLTWADDAYGEGWIDDIPHMFDFLERFKPENAGK